MTNVNSIFKYLNEIAPTWLAESYDNPGLLVGDKNSEVKKALLCLDITSKCINEAKEKNAQLLISHHPVIFRPIKNVLANSTTVPVFNLIKNDMSAICMHTNLDRAEGGVNDCLCEAIGLTDIIKIGETVKENFKKIFVFVPVGFEEKVRSAMANAGAGKLGEYDGCAFEAGGNGYFRPLDGANPFIGNVGKYEKADEVKIEAICEPSKVKAVVRAMLEAHPYEVPAYDIFDDEAVSNSYPIGRLGSVKEPTTVAKFAESVKRSLNSSCVKYVTVKDTVSKVAVCSGTADEDFFEDALDAGADTVLTGELKHHMYNLAAELGLNVVEAGHFATEAVVLPCLEKKLKAKFNDVDFFVAENCVEPYNAI